MDNLSKLVELTKGTSLSDYDSRIYVSAENANRTIYLADLPRNTCYMDISEYFEGKIGSCQIAIKRPLFKDFYFAFVQFQKLEHAQKALSEHRFPTIKGQVCRALPYSMDSSFIGTVAQTGGKRDSGLACDPQKQIFVKNCPKQWTHQDLYEQFSPHGTINSAKISITAEFTSRGYGFVEFATVEDARNAVKAMDGKEIEKAPSAEAASGSSEEEPRGFCKLQVTHFESKRVRSTKDEKRCSTNLYVKNFPSKADRQASGDSDSAASDESQGEFNDSDLVSLFRPFGDIVSATVMKDEGGKSKGFGFVCFVDWQDAQKAIDHFKKLSEEIQGGIFVGEAKSKEQRQHEVAKKTYQWKKSMMHMNLIVKGVAEDTTESELTDFFAQFGNVSNVKLLAEVGIAFVSFTDRESARAAKQATSEILFKGRHLYVAFTEPRETRRLHFEEKMDKKSYEKHQMHVMGSKNADLIQLISSLGLLMNQLQGGNQPRRMNSVPMAGQQRHGYMGQQPLNGVVGHQIQNGQHPRQRYGSSNGYGHQQHRKIPNQRVNHNQQMGNQAQSQASGQPQQIGYQGGYNQMHQHQHQQMTQPMSMQMQGQQPQQQQQQQAPLEKPQVYQQEIYGMFNSQEFAQSTADARKEIIGTAIYKHVHEMVGEEHAPKVTGMIIDLDPVELNMSIQQYADLQSKVNSAMQLLVTNNLVNAPPPTTEKPPQPQA